MENINHKITSAFLWKLSERVSTQTIGLVVQIVLARLLAPSLFGELAIILVFLNYSSLFVQSGISTYIIQKKDLRDEDLESVLFLTLLMACIMYAIIFMVAPAVAAFWKSEILSTSLRLISLSLFPAAFISVYQGILQRHMNFRALFLRSIIAIPFSGVTAIIFALNGGGLWALVIQQCINQFLTAILMILPSHKIIFPRVHLSNVKEIINFGGNVLIQSLLLQLIESARTLIIGKVYSSRDLAYFDKGQVYTNYIYSGMSMTLSSVLLPTLSKVQSDKKDMKHKAKMFLSTFMLVSTPLLTIFASTSNHWVPLILTDKWIPAIVFVKIFAVSKILGPIVTVNLQIYYALGLVNLTKNLIIIECIINVITLLITYRINIEAIACCAIIVSLIDVLIFTIPNDKNIAYSMKEQMRDVLPYLTSSFIVFVIIEIMSFSSLDTFLLLCLEVLIGIATYIFIMLIIKDERFLFIVGCIKSSYEHWRHS